MTPLRLRMIEDMQTRYLAPLTQSAYLLQVSLFARHFGQSPQRLGREDIRAGAGQTLGGQLDFGRGGRIALLLHSYPSSKHGPSTLTSRPACCLGNSSQVLSQNEVGQFLDAVESLKHRVILAACYAAGLRVSEAVRMKPAAIDSQRMVIRVEDGKGRKDRYVMLSPKLLDILRDYWKATRPTEWLFPGDRRLRRNASRRPGPGCTTRPLASRTRTQSRSSCATLTASLNMLGGRQFQHYRRRVSLVQSRLGPR